MISIWLRTKEHFPRKTSRCDQQVTNIAETHGGFVVTSEAKQRESNDPSQRTLDIKLVVRVPSDQFGRAFDEIKRLAGNTPSEIMRQANKISDALEVQRQIAEVRTEIEKLEGRKRFLENRSSLSTINVNIQTPKPVITVTETGFRHSLREAVSDSISLASDMVLFFARFLIMMAPVTVLCYCPWRSCSGISGGARSGSGSRTHWRPLRRNDSF
jgi:hypothetical protein